MITINKRNIGVCILLSFLTFGIYKFYWAYLLIENTRAVKKDQSSCTGEAVCLFFVPFYSLYWWYSRGEIVKESFADHCYIAKGNAGLYLVLGLFGLSIISMAIMQNDFNSLTSESTKYIERSAWIKEGDLKLH